MSLCKWRSNGGLFHSVGRGDGTRKRQRAKESGKEAMSVL